MKIKFLGQGYKPETKNSVGSYLIDFLNSGEFDSFTAISAFASESGVSGLAKHILPAKKRFKQINIIIGVDQKCTSKEALREILKLQVNAYVFYFSSRTIFHPKIYLFEGERTSKLIIGSSNLTSSGLFSNIESSILVELDSSLEGKMLLTELKEYFVGIFSFDDPNLKLLTGDLIESLLLGKIIVTEEERRVYERINNEGEEKDISKRLITDLFPKRKTPQIPSEFVVSRRGRTKSKKNSLKIELKISEKSKKEKLVWLRKHLPASSVQAVGEDTNPTGGLRLVQDKFKINNEVINQTKYFRNIVFVKLNWAQIRTKPFVEGAEAQFNVKIKGKSIGTYLLELRHKPSGEAGQGNYTTSISWGKLGDIIRQEKLVGHTLRLFDSNYSDEFFIEIG